MHFSGGSIYAYLHGLWTVTLITTWAVTALQDRLHWNAEANQEFLVTETPLYLRGFSQFTEKNT